MSKKIKPVSDYILLAPDKPKGGDFDPGQLFINETATVVDAGPLCSENIQKLIGKHVLFNAWACDEKKIGEDKYYLAPESANAICAVI